MSNSSSSVPMDVAFDMETGDPDDYFSLVMLCSHPAVTIRCVTITPGTKDQVAFVRAVLEYFSLNIPVGSRKPDHPKQCLSKFIGSLFPNYRDISGEPDGLGCDVLYKTLKEYPDLVIITGAPLTNIGEMLTKYDLASENIMIKKLVAQGGFAGDNVVPEEHRMKKFSGMTHCATYNFGGDAKSALAMLNSDRIAERICVSKNVCHSLSYDREMHSRLKQVLADMEPSTFKTGLKLTYDGMKKYLQRNSEKKFHDPLACCVAINRDVCLLEKVVLERGPKNEWGSKKTDEGNTYISVALDKDLFFKTFTNTHHQI